MNEKEICVGARVLIQKTRFVREIAEVKAIMDDKVIVKLSDGNIIDIQPKYILKSFGISSKTSFN